MSFDRRQFTRRITEVLTALGMFSESALRLLLGTSAQESRFGTYLYQMGDGPARGIFQMEPSTEKDI